MILWMVIVSCLVEKVEVLLVNVKLIRNVRFVVDLKLGGYVCVGIGGKNEVVFVLVCRVMFVMLEDV